jgi:hypothetical protein
MTTIARDKLLIEIEDVIRTMPPRATIRHETPENLAWMGRALAVMHLWDPVRAVMFDQHVNNTRAVMALPSHQGVLGVITMLHQAAHELRLETVGPLTIAVAQGGVFDYFDEIRKVIEEAKLDLLFVDPYLNADFVSRYLPHISQGVSVRLLGRENMATLIPAVELLSQQTGLAIHVRSANGLHDRYVFVDRQSCYQSGASFKDGAKKGPTTLTQIIDAFDVVLETYEKMWALATIQKQ